MTRPAIPDIPRRLGYDLCRILDAMKEVQEKATGRFPGQLLPSQVNIVLDPSTATTADLAAAVNELSLAYGSLRDFLVNQ